MLKTVLSEKLGGGRNVYSAPRCEVLNLDTESTICQSGAFSTDEWLEDENFGLDF